MKASEATIEPELDRDAAGIDRVLCEAFPTPLEARLVAALRRSGRLAISFVARREDQVVGHIAFSPVTVGASDVQSGLGLGPLAVSPLFQRQGLGSRLVEAGLMAARLAGAGFVVVLGDPAYYSRFGFEPAARFGLLDEYGGGAAFQAILCRSGALAGSRGLVKYCSEFGLVTGEAADP